MLEGLPGHRPLAPVEERHGFLGGTAHVRVPEGFVVDHVLEALEQLDTGEALHASLIPRLEQVGRLDAARFEERLQLGLERRRVPRRLVSRQRGGGGPGEGERRAERHALLPRQPARVGHPRVELRRQPHTSQSRGGGGLEEAVGSRRW